MKRLRRRSRPIASAPPFIARRISWPTGTLSSSPSSSVRTTGEAACSSIGCATIPGRPACVPGRCGRGPLPRLRFPSGGTNWPTRLQIVGGWAMLPSGSSCRIGSPILQTKPPIRMMRSRPWSPYSTTPASTPSPSTVSAPRPAVLQTDSPTHTSGGSSFPPGKVQPQRTRQRRVCCGPDGIRTRVAGLKGQSPRPLDDGAAAAHRVDGAGRPAAVRAKSPSAAASLHRNG